MHAREGEIPAREPEIARWEPEIRPWERGLATQLAVPRPYLRVPSPWRGLLRAWPPQETRKPALARGERGLRCDELPFVT